MKSKTLTCTVCLIPALVLAIGMRAPAEDKEPTQFRGTINDFTPTTSMPGGPWEVRGDWSLSVKGNVEKGDGKADFFAALTMERSDLGVVLNGGNNLNSPADRMDHTHHIKLIDGQVTVIPNGIEIVGPATITANGAWPPPFGSAIPVLTIQITGGTGENSVPFSNISIAFGAPADHHFGTNPLHGVVRSAK